MEQINYTDQGRFCSGHVACGGCAEAVALRVILNIVGPNAVAVVAPSCTAVICGAWPGSSVKIPVFHTTLESCAASASGVKRALVKQGKDDTLVLGLAGDGGTYDIGLQALSSAAERNEDILYICFDNEGYMNTGGQKSSSTPLNAATGSTPTGKATRKKNIIDILAAHRIPYIATASPSDINDMAAKLKKAISLRGTKFLSILIPCLPGWGIADDSAVKVARLAVDSGAFPLFEIEDGVRVSMKPRDNPLPVAPYLKLQKRYLHLTDADLEEIQANVDSDWQRIQQRADQS
ncbi:MAG: pyruvate synthase subunit beta [Hyphomicrobiales bacterium]|nr:pyruvate synthase subunit beta [Hyphomicrobiales bacterium]MCP4998325.1 pyruvate synthase subunit beta [Hyphomicrobiales bacterium]